MRWTPLALVCAIFATVGAIGFLGFATLDNSWDTENTRVSLRSLGPFEQDTHAFLLENRSSHAVYYRGNSVSDINYWITYGNEEDGARESNWVKGQRSGLLYQELPSNSAIPVWVTLPPGEYWQILLYVFEEPYDFSRALRIESIAMSPEVN